MKSRFFLTGFTLGVLVTAGMLRLLPLAKEAVQAAVGTVTIDQSVGGTVTLGTVDFQKIQDSANTAFFLDPAATGDSLVVAGTATASGNLTVGNTSAIRSAFGPLSLQYKSGLNAWTTGLTLQDTTGNVGLGTTVPAQKLDVVGTVKATAFSGDGSALTGIAGTPAGAVVFFNLTACPSGWTELTAARGMYIVGNPLSGTLATAVGTALTNLENRAVGQHLHSVDPASTGVSISDPGHTHSIRQGQNEGGDVQYRLFYQGSNIGNGSIFSSTTGISASVDIAAFNSANAGSVAGTNAPYIQLLACQKS